MLHSFSRVARPFYILCKLQAAHILSINQTVNNIECVIMEVSIKTSDMISQLFSEMNISNF